MAPGRSGFEEEASRATPAFREHTVESERVGTANYLTYEWQHGAWLE
ncbi:MAG TPA: hypothetical protein VNO75_03885 [Gemmatimonadaceae bacterium]|nr:hypothetical protein [Gemmatimonadaceae bacterium]